MKNSWMELFLMKHGRICVQYPWRVMLISLSLTILLSLGNLNLKIQTNPEKIWVPPKSISTEQKEYFDHHFGAFFRIEQLIFTSPTGKEDLIDKHYLQQMANVQKRIENDGVMVNGKKITYQDLCFRPIRGKGCLIESPLQYWLNDPEILQNDPDIKLTTSCQTKHPMLMGRSPCMDNIGIPVMKNVILGGIGEDLDPRHQNPDPCGEKTPTAKALIVTFLLENSNDTVFARNADMWEKHVFISQAAQAAEILKKDFTYPLSLSYMAQRSVSDAIALSTSQNIFVVVVSYLCMFVYIGIALGQFPDRYKSRFLLGMTGIFIVISSILMSLGICSFFGVEVTLIVIEVVPFLILAIGVDNIFIITKEMDRRETLFPEEMLEDRIGHTLIKVCPSILAAAFSEILAFGVGAMTNIPALKSFCIVASVSVFVDLVLQLTCFVSALALDTRRVQDNRLDCFPCYQGSPSPMDNVYKKPHPLKDRIGEFIACFYEPCLYSSCGKVFVLFVFIGMLCISTYGMTQLHLGLEPQLALPSDFYLYDYFGKQTKLGEAGPSAYIVIKDVNYTSRQTQKDLNEMVNKLSFLQQYIQTPIYSWLDAFNQWRQMRQFLEERIQLGTSDCPSQQHVMTPFHYESTTAEQEYTSDALFYPLVQNFTNIAIDSQCCQNFGICGAQYAMDIHFKKNFLDQVDGIEASRFRCQVTSLKNQSMFINSYFYGNHFTQEWSKGIGYHGEGSAAFMYSLYFIFYEQYQYIQGVALQNLLLALVGVFMATLVTTDLRTSLLVVLSVGSIAINIIGAMWLWNFFPSDGFGVEINAISVVNLVMAIGLSVEFCVHIASSFLQRSGSNASRSRMSLREMGSSVITGITLTKLCGVSVLAFAPSRLYRLYYFRMYMAIIILGVFHGLAVLPILLLYFGKEDQELDRMIQDFKQDPEEKPSKKVKKFKKFKKSQKDRISKLESPLLENSMTSQEDGEQKENHSLETMHLLMQVD